MGRPSLKELKNLASFCQNEYNFRLYEAPVANLRASLEGSKLGCGKLRRKGLLIPNPTFREQRHSAVTKAAN
jgi:hypothetical protein